MHTSAPPVRLTHTLFILSLSSREKRPGESNYKFCIAVTVVTVWEVGSPASTEATHVTTILVVLVRNFDDRGQ